MNSITKGFSNDITNTATTPGPTPGAEASSLFEAVRAIAAGLAGMVFYRGALGSAEERNQSAAYAALVVIEAMGEEQVKEALTAERTSLTRKDLYRSIAGVLLEECHANGYHQARFKVVNTITGKVRYGASWQPRTISFSDYAAGYGSGQRADLMATTSDEEIVSANTHPVHLIEDEGWLGELAGAGSEDKNCVEKVENLATPDAYPERSFARLMAGVAREFGQNQGETGRYAGYAGNSTNITTLSYSSSKDNYHACTVLRPLPSANLTPISIPTQPLTRREREVMTALLEPAVPRKLVAKWLGMSDYTLRSHLKKIYYKLRVRGICEARQKFIQLYELGELGSAATPDYNHATTNLRSSP